MIKLVRYEYPHNCNAGFIRRNIYHPTEADATNRDDFFGPSIAIQIKSLC